MLDQISQGLPERFRPKLEEVRQGLPILFRPDYPMVVQHGDLFENNFHVDEATSHITGIVEWADAMIAPFGVSLSGLETVLGVQTSSCWYFHPNHVKLREHFWDIFNGDIGQISTDDRRSIEVTSFYGWRNLLSVYFHNWVPDVISVCVLSTPITYTFYTRQVLCQQWDLTKYQRVA